MLDARVGAIGIGRLEHNDVLICGRCRDAVAVAVAIEDMLTLKYVWVVFRDDDEQRLRWSRSHTHHTSNHQQRLLSQLC